MARVNISIPDNMLEKIRFLRRIKFPHTISKICQNAISAAFTRKVEMELLGPKWFEFRSKKNALMTREELVLRLRRSKKESDLRKEYGL